MTKGVYNIGELVWFQGSQVEVFSDPYMLYGSEWQDAKGDNGNVVTLSTPRHKTMKQNERMEEHKRSQENFARLHKSAND